MDTGKNLPPSNTIQANLPTIYHKTMEDSYPSVLNNISNAGKRFFRYTLDKIERAVRYVYNKGTSHTGASSIQKAISIRTTKAKDMLNNASLPLSGNKNLRAHRANIKEIFNMHPDATVVALCSNGNRLTSKIHEQHKNLPEENKEKCIFSDVLQSRGTSSARYDEFTNAQDVYSLVNQMFKDMEEQKESDFTNNKEIKLVVQTPPFMVPEGSEFKEDDCAKEYITACEAWQLHLQKKYNKKVTILPFRTPKDTNTKNDVKFTENNNKAYDAANAKLAKISQQDKESSLVQYITKYIQENPEMDSDTLEINNLLANELQPLYLNDTLDKVKKSFETDQKKNKLDDATSSLGKIDKPYTWSIREKTSIKNGNILFSSEIETRFSEDYRKDEDENTSILHLTPTTRKKMPAFYVSSKPGDPLQYSCDLRLMDYPTIAKYAEDNNVDIGVAVFCYLGSLGKTIFHEKADYPLIQEIITSLEQDIEDRLKLDTSQPIDINIQFAMTYSIPEEFITALQDSKDENISLLVKQYGAANVFLKTITCMQVQD